MLISPDVKQKPQRQDMSTVHEVVLISMPFGNLLTPSIGLGLLKSVLTETGIPSKILNFQFRFAKLIGEQAYTRIHSGTRTEHLAGEFIFSDSLFGDERSGVVDRYINDIIRGRATELADLAYSEPLIAKLNTIIGMAREQVERFLEECLTSVVSLQPRVVGFTSLFHQHVASLALAKRIKSRLPDTYIVFGGSNCEGPMGAETLRQFQFVDAVVSGEGEYVFPEIVRCALTSKPIPNRAGVFCRTISALPVLHQPLRNTTTIENLDTLPVPDYDEYFEQLNSSSLGLTRKPSLLFETSRGCWWGEKHHCTFCGLNGETMAYRSKSAARAFSEFLYLTERYPGCSVNVVDNILNMHYFKDFIPMLAAQKHGFSLFFEVKANLRKDQLQLLREAGIEEIQPGIESFSDNVLRIMRKGVSALQNIQLMKWCKELGLKVYYNLIWGFPGEQADDYLEMGQLVPLITHLQPPIGDGPIRIDRFSPNFEQAQQLGFENLSPHPAYQYVYPFAAEVLGKLAYFFTPQINMIHNVPVYTKPLADEVRRWRACHGKSDLFWIDKGSSLLLWDFRPVAKEVLTVLKGYERFAYTACDQIRTVRQVVDLWRISSADRPIKEADVREALDSFTERALMVRQGDSYLALAYPRRFEKPGSLTL